MTSHTICYPLACKRRANLITPNAMVGFTQTNSRALYSRNVIRTGALFFYLRKIER